MSHADPRDPRRESDRPLPTELRLDRPAHVTRPTMPNLHEYQRLLGEIWDSRWLTNQGPFHQRLEQRLAEYLGEPHVSLFCNGTIALLVALQALRINSGQVITTPFTFPATPHVLFWNRIEPVFCDVDPETMNLDPRQIEGLISPDTRAILPVHVFGQPCDIEAIEQIAAYHGVHVIYDAAHAFGVRWRGRSLVGQGDIAMLSFHATKLFSSMEGGALICHSPEVKRRIDSLKNFGIADEETVIAPGINGKMIEACAAFGLLHLDMVEEEIRRRSMVARRYTERLSGMPGIVLPLQRPDVAANHSYYPIRVRAGEFGVSRDVLHRYLRAGNVISRKYFFPPANHYPCYAKLPSAAPALLPVSEQVSQEILCLPIYGELDLAAVDRACDIIDWVRRS
jgi:dTDP-4-amino-4,6-dideoxygalactose transaminase